MNYQTHDLDQKVKRDELETDGYPSTGNEIAQGSMANTEIKMPMNSTANTELVSRSTTFDSKQKSLKKTMSLQEPTFGIFANPSPSISYEFENREYYLKFVVPLYEASITGDWETAKSVLEKRPELIRVGLSKQLGTSLHIAVTTEESKATINFVKNLVNMMTRKELEIRNQFSNNPFWIACAIGNLEYAKIMLEKNPSLLSIRCGGGSFPLLISALGASYSAVKILYYKSHKMTGDHWEDDDKNAVLYNCLEREFFDIALQIVEDHPDLLANMYEAILGILAPKTSALNRVENKLITRVIEQISSFFHPKVQTPAKEVTDAVKILEIVWGYVIRTMQIDEIENMLKSSGILFIAAKMGNARFIAEIFRTYADLMLHTNEDGFTVFHIAVMHRHQDIYNLLYETGLGVSHDICLSMDHEGNNMLHLVGKSSKKMAAKTSGASLLMQRELLWFKEVEKIMPPPMREAPNGEDQTPFELFSKENEDLVSKGLKWMKDCMVVATLIVTVAFAVAFTAPGGYQQETGIPFFLHETTFLVFVIADAISLFSSTTSLLIFLSILVSRHDQRDFMDSLPKKLMIGLVTLFISVATMMVTFSASFFVLYYNRLQWVPILISAFATIPVIMFAILQFPLLVDMFRSTYDSRYLFKPKKRMLYNTTS